MAELSFPKIGHYKDIGAFQRRAVELRLDLPCDARILSASEGSSLAQPLKLNGRKIGNRWCIHPMEGWDGSRNGEPTEKTLRRWRHFGLSGAKLIWGGEAFAVQPDGRANPNQLAWMDDESAAERSLRQLLDELRAGHRESGGSIDDLLIGLQLTHSGRFCRPNDKRLEPKILYQHPLLDPKFGILPPDESVIISDDYIDRLIERYIAAARIAQRVGFDFVDIKHCHGYLGHEFLSAYTRPGKFGGSFENRTRFAREIIAGIRATCPWLQIGVRLSAFDHPPFHPDPDRSKPGQLGPGVPDDFSKCLPYRYAFGCDMNDPLRIDLTEPIAFVQMLRQLGVRLINVSGCSPYYNPHFQRPAMFPPSDGYQPPEDPLIGVARQVQVTRQLKAACPDSIFVGTGYTYLQEFLPHVAQAVVRAGWTDSIGIGRTVLSYPEFPRDVLEGKDVRGKKLCRTFSDCTTAPRNGIVSGCFPLDPYYKSSPEAEVLRQKKDELRATLRVDRAG